MIDKYIFPAIFEYNDDQEIAVIFPDLDIATSGENDYDALLSAKELLGLAIFGLEEDNEVIPEPSKLKEIQCEENQKVMLVDVYMPPVRNSVVDIEVEETVKVPRWLLIKAQANHLNLSAMIVSHSLV